MWCRCTPTTTSSTCTCTVLYYTDNRVIPLQSTRQWSPASLPTRVWLARKVASVSSRCLRSPIAGNNRIVSVSQLRCERDSGQRLSSQCCPDHIRTVGQSDMHTFITHKHDYSMSLSSYYTVQLACRLLCLLEVQPSNFDQTTHFCIICIQCTCMLAHNALVEVIRAHDHTPTNCHLLVRNPL